MKIFILHFVLFISLGLLLGCGSLSENQVPKVHQAWNARYQYDLENRRIVSMYENKKVGRAIGRDEFGRINYDRYWVANPFKGENLLSVHEDKLNSVREDRWNIANRNLIEARKQQLSEIATNENEEQDIEAEEGLDIDNSLPTPFLPQGIMMEPDSSDGNFIMPSNLGLEGVQPSTGLPVDSNPTVPSPFDPLPPL